MKNFYLAGAAVFTVVLLIVGFGNITASCNQLFFFYQAIDNSIPVTFIVFGIAFLGIITGFFYGAFINSMINEKKKDDDESL